ncbi:toll/interleukin-1 receptor domain-containing protein [Azospirillum sp. TSO22-1]|uniref:toll/interleukin-1 receptor domain-containing protein n=1 Tax=Azospirillum sp. TSO22-1 TaxID=716789 RepID=UPI000D610DE7|nr:toll/interleukin-1 receptor domain-containing protein [Azospirillum sp. TSO22-1]PWC40164.1 hypothetical protein TSO221_25650 [Azospirillum sp. TSO22-1]
MVDIVDGAAMDIYHCFISYPCIPSIEGFVEDLRRTLILHLNRHFPTRVDDKHVFLDRKRLEAGELYDETLCQTICRSVCMIVVYCPQYGSRNYCKKEYSAMRLVEHRRSSLHQSSNGLIIPLVVGGRAEDVPQEIKRRHHRDFSRCLIGRPGVMESKKFSGYVDEIATYILDRYRELDGHMQNAFGFCSEFESLESLNGDDWAEHRPRFVFRD